MQFKRQGRRVQVLAYRGYDKDKRRAIVKMMGSIDRYSYEPSDGLVENLTDDEKIELQSYIEKERQATKKIVRQYEAISSASRISEVSDTITAGDFEPSEAWAADIWAAIDALSKAVRKAGYPKPRKATQKAAAAPMPGQAGLPLGDVTETPDGLSCPAPPRPSSTRNGVQDGPPSSWRPPSPVPPQR